MCEDSVGGEGGLSPAASGCGGRHSTTVSEAREGGPHTALLVRDIDFTSAAALMQQ